VLVEWFTYDIVAIRDAILTGTQPLAEPEPAYGLVFQLPGRDEPVRLIRLNAATMVLLERCDGRRTVAAIVEDAERELGATALADKARVALQQLVNANVIA
jgi:hypothetical protein